MTSLDLLGQGVLLASLGLPLLWLIARGENTEPASRHRRLVLALVFSNALLLAPQLWARVPGAGGKPAEVFHAMVAPAPSAQGLERSLSALSVLAICWLVSSAFALLRTLLATWRLRRTIEEANAGAEADSQRARELAQQLGLSTPRVLESSDVTVPCAASPWRPVILIPRGLRARLSDETFGRVLIHELHHVKRHDQAWALVVALLRVPFALHPVTKRLLREISLAREAAVDALVAQSDATAYASALVEVAAQTNTGSGFPDAVFMGADALSKRVDMLMNPRPLRRARLAPLLVAAVLLGALAMSASPAKAAEPWITDGVVLSPMAPISVRVGTSTILNFAGVTHSQIGDERLAEVCTLRDGKVHVDGRALGSTTLTIWTDKGNFTYPISIEL